MLYLYETKKDFWSLNLNKVSDTHTDGAWNQTVLSELKGPLAKELHFP